MRIYTPGERQFILTLSQAIIAAIVAEELPIFQDLAEEYFEDPTPPELSQELSDDPLASGLAEFLVPATPAAVAMVSTALDYIQHAAISLGNTSDPVPTTDIIRAVIYNQDRRAEVRQQVYRAALTFHMPDSVATLMTGRLIDALDELAADSAPDQRVINAWIEGHAPDAPLQMHQTYRLSFNIGSPRPAALATAGGVDDQLAALPPEQATVEITVLVESDDFLILEANPQTLYVSRTGASNTAQFAITPAHAGIGAIRAFFAIKCQTFQSMRLTLQIGGTSVASTQPTSSVSGISFEDAARLPATRPGLSLIITKQTTGYKLMLHSSGGLHSAVVNISESQIAELVRRARDTLRAIVHRHVNNEAIYQRLNTMIPEAEHACSLRSLAELGRDFYNKLFYNGRSKDANAMGDLLCELMAAHQFNIIVIAEHFVFPWALLYDGDDIDTIDVERFWGFRHLIACIPESTHPEPRLFTPQIDVDQQINLGFIYNANLDRDKSEPQRMVQRQRDFFKDMPNVAFNEYVDRESLLRLLKNSSDPHHILYFYCHAISYIPEDVDLLGVPRGVAQSRLFLTDGPVTLLEMERYAPARLPPFKQAPLVFLNACESAELSPYLYDGLVPYLVARGARSVLGTEVDTPVYFAAEFAQKLLEHLNTGTSSLGEILLSLRRAYLFEKRNVLGLLYTLYGCDITIRRTRATGV